MFLKTLHILQKKTPKLVAKIWLLNLDLYQTDYMYVFIYSRILSVKYFSVTYYSQVPL